MGVRLALRRLSSDAPGAELGVWCCWCLGVAGCLAGVVAALALVFAVAPPRMVFRGVAAAATAYAQGKKKVRLQHSV